MRTSTTPRSRMPARRLAGATTLAFTILLPLAVTVEARAQSPTIEFESRQKADPAPTAPLPLVDRKSLVAPISGVDSVIIKSFRFSGAHLIPAETLAAELTSFTGRELSAADLQRAALEIAGSYLRRGGMARVRVAAVSRAEGIAEIEIRELRIGRLRVELPTETRIPTELVARFVTDGLEAGAPVPLARLEDGIALLNAQPGIAAAIAIDAGAKPDEVDIAVSVRDRPVFSGRIMLDNHGLREIGQDRLGLTLNANNAFGLAERLSLGLEQTAGSDLLAPAFSVALPNPNLRLGFEATVAHYEARRGGAAIELKGDFLHGRVFLQHRWRYASGVALNAEYAVWRTAYRDDSLFGELRRRRISGVGVNFSGVARNGGGLTRFGFDVDHGRADLSANAGDFALDAASAKVDGGFWRLRWNLGHEFAYGAGRLALRANGQWTDRNLDSTQQFALGGAIQVRAYPTAEALGDGGWIAAAEWRQAVAADVDGRLFVDSGSIKRNAKPWVDQRNRFDLSGIGAGLDWRLPENFRFAADLARQTGGNPGRNPDGTDSDGRDTRWRLWLSLRRDF